jgi:hypothetical protein
VLDSLFSAINNPDPKILKMFDLIPGEIYKPPDCSIADWIINWTASHTKLQIEPSYENRIIEEVEREIKMCERVPRNLKA